MKRLVLWGLCAALAGCAAPRWYKPGAGQQDFDRDTYQCEMEAMMAFPVAMVEQPNAMQPTTRTTCTSMFNQMNCTSSQGPVYPGYRYDANAIPRSNMIPRCLRARGWARVQ